MNIKTIWTDAHAPKVNKYILELETDSRTFRVHYTEVVVNGRAESYRVEDDHGSLITDGKIIWTVRNHVSIHPGPPK